MPELLESPTASNTAQLAAQLHPAAGMGDERTADAPQKDKSELEARKQNALKGLVRAYDLEAEVIRRHHVRRFLEAEEFWQANQHLIWSERQFRWQTPFEWATENKRDDVSIPRYQYVTNIYRSLGLSIIAAISQRLPKVRFQPKSTKNEIDIATARAASDIVDMIERNNDLDQLSVRCAYLLYTQGTLGAWVRYVMDKQFGTQQVPKIEMGPTVVHEDEYFCPQCATETPAAQLNPGGGMMPEQQLQCPNCGAPLGEGDFRPSETGIGPVVTEMQEFPEGQEVISIYGGMNLKMLPTAEKLKDSLYLILVEEKHLANVRAAYPPKAAEIGGGASGAPADNNYERYARLSLFDSSPNYRNAQPFSKHVTVMNAWLRNEAFYYLEEDDEIRTELIKDYPDGVRVVLAGDEFLDAIPEDVDQCWEVCRPMPGVGMYVQGAGHDVIPVQKRYNDDSNIRAEHVEFGSAPPVMVDGRYINVEALRNKRMQPASYFPVAIKNAPGSAKLVDMTHQMEIKIDNMVASGAYGQSLLEIAQFECGALPSIFGGAAPNAGKTASEYAMSRVQSLGKLNLFWRAVMSFWAKLQMLSVDCFRRNRTKDYEHVVTERSGDFVSKFIHLENLRGNITAHPESDQDFPASWAEIRENVLEMIKLAPAETIAMLTHTANAPLLKRVLASPDMYVPGEDDREKQFREIQDLLQSQPMPEMAPVPGPVDPATGAPLGPPPVDPMGQPVQQPTGKLIPIANGAPLMAEPFVDNQPAHIQTLQEWMVDDDGLDAKKNNPAGYANVMAHLMSHIEATAYEQAMTQKIAMEQMAKAGIPPQMMAPPGGGGDQGTPKKGESVPGGTPKKPPQGAPAGPGQFPGATSKVQEISKQPV